MAKRQKILKRGEEEEWKWLTFGNNLAGNSQGQFTYAFEHQLPWAGTKHGGKMCMVECCKIAFYVEPWIIAKEASAPNEVYYRFTIQANEIEEDVALDFPFTAGDYNIHSLLQRPEVYWVHTEWIGYKTDNRFNQKERPDVYDVTAPNGQGILFKGDRLWVTYMVQTTTNTVPQGQASFAFRCLCRPVWVDPTYYITSGAAADNAGGKIIEE